VPRLFPPQGPTGHRVAPAGLIHYPLSLSFWAMFSLSFIYHGLSLSYIYHRLSLSYTYHRLSLSYIYHRLSLSYIYHRL
jgi:hypothetical protein